MQISIGESYTYVLNSKGKVYSFGKNDVRFFCLNIKC